MTEVTTEYAWLSLGCNVGHRGLALACMRQRLGALGLEILAASGEVLTRPIGVTGQADFHNQAVLVRSPRAHDAAGWLSLAQETERDCGRRRTHHWGPRRADCDILLLGERGEFRHPGDPEVPHPQLPNRPYLGRLIAEVQAQHGGGGGAVVVRSAGDPRAGG